MARLALSPASLRRHAALVAAIVTGLACTGGAWLAVRAAVGAQQDARFDEVVTAGAASLRDRMEAYAQMLRATRGAIAALGHPPEEREFQAFAESLAPDEQYPGIQALGWTVALPAAAVAAHEQAQRAAGRAGYRVWPEGDRPFYTAIVHLYPSDWRNARAIGFDMFSEPVRRAAMERARDGADVAASGKVELVQEAGTERQAGFLLYSAVFARRGDPGSLVGWVFAPFRASDLIRAAVAGEGRRAVTLSVYEGGAADDRQRLHADPAPAASGGRHADVALEVYGRIWLLRFEERQELATPAERLLPPLAVALGLALTTLLAWITRAEIVGRSRAEQAARRTAFVAAAGKALAASLEYDRTLGRVARLAAGRVADACVVCVVEPDGPVWRVGHRDPAVTRALSEALAAAPLDEAALEAVTPPFPRIRAAALSVLPARATPELVAVLSRARFDGALVAPLVARGEAFGAVTLLAAPPRVFTRTDAAVLQDLCRLASAAVDTARLYRREQAAVLARDEFLSIASHELKTPLTSLALQSESLLAAARRERSSTIERKAEVVRRNVERLTRLVASLLDLTRISAGHLELEVEEMDLAALAREVVDRFAEEAARAGCTLRLDAPAPVPGRWDRLRLDQVLTNLLSNALKYGPGRPVDVRVTVEDGSAVLVVRDRGIGIPTADQARVFERFERAVSRRNYGGFGLGLWIVRQIVEALDGSVALESAPGAGSTFRVELPAAAATTIRAAEKQPGA
jgi:signal transduction histidine kinase/CHASE1-domain containing sensor protein